MRGVSWAFSWTGKSEPLNVYSVTLSEITTGARVYNFSLHILLSFLSIVMYAVLGSKCLQLSYLDFPG